MKLHLQVIEKEGKNEFVVLPFDEHQELTTMMHDYEDLRDLRTAKVEAKGQKSIPCKKAMSDLGL